MVIVRMGSLSGVLEDLIADESITEVIANGPGRVFVNREGRLEPAGRSFSGEGEVTIRDLVINSLRMRPDRIIVGECRGAEVIDMLQAMNTGRDGSLTTPWISPFGERGIVGGSSA